MSLFQKDHFINHNNRVRFFNDSIISSTGKNSGRALLNKINSHHKEVTLVKLLTESNEQTKMLDEELRRAQESSATVF